MVPPIADLTPQLPSDALADADEATVEVTRFDAEMGSEIAPFSAILLRTESASSSQIENLTASARAIAEAEITGVGRQNAVVIASNTAAMRSAISLADRLDADAIMTMHQALMSATEPKIAGKWRADQVWIGGQGTTPHSAEFVPPHAERVPAGIDDLVRFMAREDIPVLVQASIAHAHFETIHPFPDGNGRTGRAIVHAMLRAKGVTQNVTVPVSSGLLHDTAAYYAALNAYHAGQPEDIVRCLSAASRRAVAHGRELVGLVRAVRDDWAIRLTALRKDSAARRLADGLIRQPVVNAETAATLCGVQTGNIHRHIKTLTDVGILVSKQDYRSRNMIWRAPDVLDALDRYSESIGKRT